MTPTILVVEDEPAIQELIAVNLEHAGYERARGRDAEEAQPAIRDGAARPGAARLDAARAVRPRVGAQLRADARTRELPIIMLTARAEEADKVAGLEARRRRLRHQAVLAEGAGRAHQGGAAPARAAAGRASRGGGSAAARSRRRTA